MVCLRPLSYGWIWEVAEYERSVRVPWDDSRERLELLEFLSPCTNSEIANYRKRHWVKALAVMMWSFSRTILLLAFNIITVRRHLLAIALTINGDLRWLNLLLDESVELVGILWVKICSHYSSLLSLMLGLGSWNLSTSGRETIFINCAWFSLSKHCWLRANMCLLYNLDEFISNVFPWANNRSLDDEGIKK